MEKFCRKQLKNSLNHTLLCILHEDENGYFMDVMANGVVSINRFNITETLKALLQGY